YFRYRNILLSQLPGDQLGHHRADLTEHLAAFLDKQLVVVADAAFVGAIEEAEVVADAIGELGQQFGTDNFKLMRGGCLVCTLEDHCGAGVTKDEMTVAVTEVHVTGTDFRVDHKYCPGLPRGDAVDCILDAEGG